MFKSKQTQSDNCMMTTQHCLALKTSAILSQWKHTLNDAAASLCLVHSICRAIFDKHDAESQQGRMWYVHLGNMGRLTFINNVTVKWIMRAEVVLGNNWQKITARYQSMERIYILGVQYTSRILEKETVTLCILVTIHFVISLSKALSCIVIGEQCNQCYVIKIHTMHGSSVGQTKTHTRRYWWNEINSHITRYPNKFQLFTSMWRVY